MTSSRESGEDIPPSSSSVVRACSSNMSKRGAAKEKIQQYYFQLTEGCGRANCSNPDCASHSEFTKLSSNDAAAKAICLFKCKAVPCEKHPSKIPRTEDSESPCTSSATSAGDILVNTCTATDTDWCDNTKTTKPGSETINNELKKISVTESLQSSGDVASSLSKIAEYETHFLMLEKFCNLTTEPGNDFLISVKQSLWTVFSNVDCLIRFALLKEKVKSQSGCDEDKDINEADDTIGDNLSSVPMLVDDELGSDPHCSSATMESKTVNLFSTENLRPTVDVEFIRSFFQQCSRYAELERLLVNAISYLVDEIKTRQAPNPEIYKDVPNYLNLFVIAMENCALQNPESLETAFPNLCHVLSHLPIPAQAILAKFWSEYNARDLLKMVESLHQLITIKVVSEYGDDSDLAAHEDRNLSAASKCLHILYHASIIGGDINRDVSGTSHAEASTLQQDKWKQEDDELSMLVDGSVDKFVFKWTDQLGKYLHQNNLDSVSPKVPFVEFVNEALNECIQIDKDYANYRVIQQGSNKFSFLQYPFLLNVYSKTKYFFFDNRVRMYSERRRTVISSFMHGSTMINPYLKLQVRRSHVIDDTLIQLELAAENSSDLKKQVFVEFDGEEGVDEGGVSKEFFQLVVEKIFNPENGMFVYDEDTNLFFFNPHSFESLMQYKLIGIVLGLAIYNNCILDINFPLFVYKKLLGRRATFSDMKDAYPVMYKSLKNLLEYDGDVEEDIMVTFKIQYQDVFGETLSHELKENGEHIPVTNENREEYVNLYAEWLLNQSITEQFNAFRIGFDLVVNESPLKYIFYPHELELIIRGSEDYDFDELEETTEYSGGFSRQSQTIIDFWSVVHELNHEEKRTLLQFTTGSDRAPVGGLSKLKMIIAKNGPDSERLPTAHTCFNVILLPDYSNRSKLKERLLKAIKYSKGFGML